MKKGGCAYMPNFVVESKLYTSQSQKEHLDRLFYASNKMYNTLVTHANDMLHLLYEDEDYKHYLDLYINEKDEKVKKEHGKQLTAIRERYGLTQYASVDTDGFFDYEGYISETSLLQVQVYEDESSNFYIDAYLISFDYSWPTSKINDFASAHNITETVPAYPYADLYEVSFSYESLGILIIYCYTEDTNSEQKYITILENAGLTLTYSDEYGTYYGPSPLGSYQIAFFYDAEYGSLDIYIYGDQE
jgi:hypothetical protein